jgi:hypothetical protein
MPGMRVPTVLGAFSSRREICSRKLRIIRSPICRVPERPQSTTHKAKSSALRVLEIATAPTGLGPVYATNEPGSDLKAARTFMRAWIKSKAVVAAPLVWRALAF